MNPVKQTIFFRIYFLLPLAYQKRGVWVILLMVFNAFLDFFSIASFLPLIFLIINPDFVSSNRVAAGLYNYMGFSSVTSFIIVLTIGVLFFVLIKNLVSMWIARAKVNYAFEIGQNLSSRAIANYMALTFSEFSSVDFTRELNRITNYPIAFAKSVIVPMTTLISEIFICLLFLSGMAYYDYKMLLLLFIILLPALFIYRLRKKTLEKMNHDLKEKYPAILKSALQVVEGFPEIKTYNKEAFFQKKFQGLSKEVTQTFIKDQTLQSGTTRLTEIIVGIITCSLIVYAASAYQDHRQTLLLLTVYSGASFRLIPSLNRILHASQQLTMHNYLLEELDLRPDLGSGRPRSSFAPLTFDHTISFRNISFHYPGGPGILKDISFTIRKGEKVGITGNSGEGKTSLLLVLLRFLKETGGEISVDDKFISDESGWRKLLGYVPQNPYIVDGTLSENIAFGISPGDIDRSKVLQIMDDLELNDLVQQLPDGIDSRIGERGAKLSGGQKQRLAIGRALYADAEILLFDEVTNQVHASLEADIMDLLNHMAVKKKTIIMVTHKVRTSFFDTVYHLEKGRLKEVVMPRNN